MNILISADSLGRKKFPGCEKIEGGRIVQKAWKIGGRGTRQLTKI